MHKRCAIEINDRFKEALDLMERGSKNIFVTGKAGTGKSTLLDYFRNSTSKAVVVLAPTGVAAVNIGGQTIHSFFGFKPDITPERAKQLARSAIKKGRDDIYRELDAVVIDEISMVRADLLDCVDEFLKIARDNRREPCGGAQIIMIGDLYQLPPVVTRREQPIFREHYRSEYFFDSHAFGNLDVRLVELEKIYRQSDERFIGLLNAIRNRSITDEDVEELNERFMPDFEPDGDFHVHLASLNRTVAAINDDKLMALRGRLRTFTADVAGDVEPKSYPADEELGLKKGAQVMFLNNDSNRRWINGTIGRVVDMDEDEIEVELKDGGYVYVEPHTWEIFNYELDRHRRAIEARSVGSFTQFPLKLAWAVTVHKSQGKTFERVVIDLSRGMFAAGQAYVAFSRCTSLDGIVLKHRLSKKHVLVDWRVVRFMTSFQYGASERAVSTDDKVSMIRQAIGGKARLKITYLKNNDIKSRREIAPIDVGMMEYAGKPFLGMRAFCHARGEERTFRVDRILEIEQL